MAREIRRRGLGAHVSLATMESFGIAALEARAAGLPVVALRRGGVREFVEDGVDGLCAPMTVISRRR